MPLKTISTVKGSRRLVICDNFGKECEHRNLKEHTKRVNPGCPHREMLAKGQWILEFTTEPKHKTLRTQDLCVMCYVLCVMSYVLCVMCYVLCVMCYVLCVMCYVLCVMCYV